jgi:hypothetical protein
MKRLILCINLALAAVFAFKLFALNAEIGSQADKETDSLDETPVQVQRPAVKASEKVRNIFGVMTPETSTLPSDRSELEGHNELVAGDEIIRLRGVFITQSERYAVISVSNKKIRGKEDIKKVHIGEEIRGFTVSAIQSTHVSLSDASAEPFLLKIFEPLE